MSSLVTQQRNDFVNPPNVVGHPRFHGRRHAERLVNGVSKVSVPLEL